MLLVAALVLTAPAWAAEASFQLPGLEGGALSSGDLGQGKTILVVWDPGSPACQEIVARVNQIVTRWGSQARVVTVVSQGTAAQVAGFLEGQTLEAPVYHDADGAFARHHEVREVPWLLIYEDGGPTLSRTLPIDPDPPIRQTLG